MKNNNLSILTFTIFILSLVHLSYNQGLFPLFFQNPQFGGFSQLGIPPQAALPPKTPKGRPPNEKLKSCCNSLNQADADCKSRFCDFNSLSSNTVKIL